MIDIDHLMEQALEQINTPLEDLKTQNVYLTLLGYRLRGLEIPDKLYTDIVTSENDKNNLNVFFHFLESLEVQKSLESIQTDPNQALALNETLQNQDFSIDTDTSSGKGVKLTPKQDIRETPHYHKISTSASKSHPFVEWLKDHTKSEENSFRQLVADRLQDARDDYSEHELASKSVQEDHSMVSESLAELHVKQGNIEKAIEMYQQLILKKPEKKSFFAEKIQGLKNQ